MIKRIKCFYCKKEWHMIKKYFKKKKDEKGRIQESGDLSIVSIGSNTG